MRFVSHPGLAVVVLGVRFGSPGPLISREVRRAIYLAVDPSELVERSGIEASPVDQIVPPSVFGYLPGEGEQRPRPDEASELLRQAGYPAGFDATLEMAEAFAPIVGLPGSRLSARLEKGESPFFSIGWSCNGDASHIFDALLHAATRIVLEDLPLIPLFNRKRTYGVDQRLRFEPRLNGQVLVREISLGRPGRSG